MSFKSTFNRGFHMTFDNGLTISVQWGTSNYCERKKPVYLTDELRNATIDSKDAEIAIWENQGEKRFLNFGSDEVKGYCSPNEVAEWIHRVSIVSSLDTLQELINDDGNLRKLYPENNFNKLFGNTK